LAKLGEVWELILLWTLKALIRMSALRLSTNFCAFLSFSDVDLDREGSNQEEDGQMMSRRFARLYVPTLIMALVLLYMALTNVRLSTAKMMPAVMTFEAAQSASQEEMAATSKVLEQRLSSYLQSGARFAIEGNRLVVSLPLDAEPSVVIAEASRVGQAELVDGGAQFLTIGGIVKTGPQAIPNQGVYQAILTSADFETAEAQQGEDGRPVIEFTLTPAGDARLTTHTAELRGYYLCLVVDSRVVNCPILRTPLVDRRGTIELMGDVTLDDARTLAMLLRSGPLPVPLKFNGD
jgi:preprotein translocase subunit SecD